MEGHDSSSPIKFSYPYGRVGVVMTTDPVEVARSEGMWLLDYLSLQWADNEGDKPTRPATVVHRTPMQQASPFFNADSGKP